MSYKREASLVLYDDAVVSTSTGSAAMVEFNFDEIWAFMKQAKKEREDFDPLRFSFWHVHPPGFEMYSSMDVNCVQGLNVAFGAEVYFGIVCFRGGHDVWWQKAWRFQQSEMCLAGPRRLSTAQRQLLFGLSHA